MIQRRILLVCMVCLGCAATRAAEPDPGAATAPASLPTVVDAWDLQKDFAKVRQQMESLDKILSNDDYYKVKVPDVSHWGCGIHAGHAALVLQTIAKELEKNLANPSRDADGKPAGMAKTVLTRGIIPRGVGKAPEIVFPMTPNRVHWVEVLADARQRWDKLESRSEELKACPARYKHFAFGFLTSTDWVRFGGIHTAHHLKIVRDILAASGEAGATFGAELQDRK